MTFIDMHTHNSAFEENVIKVVNIFPNNPDLSGMQHYTSVGLHPWHIKKDFNDQLLLLNNLASNSNVIAIGETGLDKAIEIDLELQTAVFIAQAEIADSHNKPMIIHSVKTLNDIMAVRKFYAQSHPWIIHGFTGNLKTAKDLINRNFYLSFGKDLFNVRSHAPEIISTIPIQNIFLETDNSEMDIKYIYQKAAELLNISVEELCTQITNNFKRVFELLKL